MKILTKNSRNNTPSNADISPIYKKIAKNIPSNRKIRFVSKTA